MPRPARKPMSRTTARILADSSLALAGVTALLLIVVISLGMVRWSWNWSGTVPMLYGVAIVGLSTYNYRYFRDRSR